MYAGLVNQLAILIYIFNPESGLNNIAAVHGQIIQATYNREPHLMHLIRKLVFFATYFNIWSSASHVSGTDNLLADPLSRKNTQLFLLHVS